MSRPFRWLSLCSHITFFLPSYLTLFISHNSDGSTGYDLLAAGSDKWSSRSSCTHCDPCSDNDPFDCMVCLNVGSNVDCNVVVPIFSLSLFIQLQLHSMCSS